MIRNILDLTKVFLISAFNRGAGKGKKRKTGRYILYGLLFVYVAGVFGFLSYEILNGLTALKQEEAFIGLVLMAVVTLVMFTTIVSTMNVLYFSDDNRFILPLPLKPVEVLCAKFNTLLVYVYMEEAMMATVPMIMYGYMTKQGIIYYLLMIAVLLMMPIVPLIIVALIVIVIMAAVRGIRNKSLVQVITMTMAIIFSLLVSMVSSSMNSGEDVMAMMDTANSLVEVYKKAFITMPMAVKALTDHDILSVILLCVVSTAAYVLACTLFQKLYYRGMLGSLYSSSGVSQKKIDERHAYRNRGLLYSYVMKEMRVYLRRPTFFVQLILPCLILPAFIMGLTYFSIVSQGGEELLLALKDIYADGTYGRYVYAVVLLAVMFISLYCFISTVAVSKDGHDAYAMKYLPVEFHRQLIYKMIPDILMCLLSYVMVAVLAMILFKVPLTYILMSMPVIVPYSFLHGFLILSDVRRPKLDWTNEMQIVKKNLRMILGMAFTLFNMGLVAVLAFLFNIDTPVLMMILSLVYIAIVLFLYRYIRRKGVSLADGFE